MVMGRPPKYDLNKEAEDLLKWCEQPDAISLYDFTNTKTYLAQELTDFAKRNENFALALKKAKEIIGHNREKACSAGAMNYGVWARSASMYDRLLYNHEQEIKDLDSQRKQKEAQVAHDNDPLVDILKRVSNRSKDLIDG